MSIFEKLTNVFKPKAVLSRDDVLRDMLKQHGDDGTKPRVVDHFAIFKTQHEAAAYMTYVLGLGFTVVESESEDCVSFTKESAVVGEQFDNEILAISMKAVELNGEYDGWGCPVAQ